MDDGIFDVYGIDDWIAVVGEWDGLAEGIVDCASITAVGTWVGYGDGLWEALTVGSRVRVTDELKL
jgi:hypothetical protein